jgi:hypothetical protein
VSVVASLAASLVIGRRRSIHLDGLPPRLLVGCRATRGRVNRVQGLAGRLDEHPIAIGDVEQRRAGSRCAAVGGDPFKVVAAEGESIHAVGQEQGLVAEDAEAVVLDDEVVVEYVAMGRRRLTYPRR